MARAIALAVAAGRAGAGGHAARWFGEVVEDQREAGATESDRSRYLFPVLLRCRVCGGGFLKASAAHVGCSKARE